MCSGRGTAGGVLAVLLALAALLAGPGVATAGTYVDPPSSPEPGAMLGVAPRAVSVAVGTAEPGFADLAILVTDSAGIRWDVGSPTLTAGTAAVALGEGLAAGSYTVDWRLVAGDGTPRSGTFLFTITPAVVPVEVPAAAVLPVPSAVWIAAAALAAVTAVAVGRLAGHRRRTGTD